MQTFPRKLQKQVNEKKGSVGTKEKKHYRSALSGITFNGILYI